jgi:shikimate kinase
MGSPKPEVPAKPVVLLIGPKHSGKTSAGRALAESLGEPFIDLDGAIEGRYGKSARALYQEGPELYRKAEVQTLEALLGEYNEKTAVLAVGGGITDNEAALELIHKNEKIVPVFLEISPDTAWARIACDAEKTGELPPFLKTADPRRTHRELHERRAADCGNIARFRVNGEGKSPEEIAAAILLLLN